MASGQPDSQGVGTRVGILGAGSTRQGLGPYLASATESAGGQVVAVAGRDLAGAERAAAALASRLGHAVRAVAGAAELAAQVDVLVVASPVPHHAEGLAAALAAGIPCLCEKPLVPRDRTAEGLALVAGFRARGLLLLENCQWPCALPALHALHPQLAGQPVRTVAMGLSPAGMGRSMVEDCLSHVLSVVQGLVAVDAGATPRHVRQTSPGALAEQNLVCFELAAAHGPVAVELHLARCPAQPRPAWLAVNGLRMDRRIGAGYAISFQAPDGRLVSSPDPMQQLVYRFWNALLDPDRDRTTAIADAVEVRLRCYARVLDALDTRG